ncbi:MAG TPA: LCP family protein [Solirubrobacteraceae bacterium]|nr:LCP family protein [Solirubrobacteraceae bacterium]
MSYVPPSRSPWPDELREEPAPRRWWFGAEALLAAFSIAALAGAATAVLAVGEVNQVVEALRQTKAVKLKPDTLAPTSKGGPETLLLVGNDERPPPKGNPSHAVEPHSNEMLLVRIDPTQPTIAMLSIPRELQVTFTTPDGQVITNRINSAYTYGYEEGHGTAGGVQLMLETIKHVLDVTVNHVFVTNFPKFRRAVNELGCVYMTVDRRYYHVNEPGGEQYFEINLQPGYQRMCGREALEFVANRHEDTSLTRDARDQHFLLAFKSQYGAGALENREKFERIFGRTVETDSSLHGTDAVVQLLELLAESAGKPVRQVHFPVNLLPTYDTASEEQIHEAVSSLMAGTGPIVHHAVTSAPTHSRSQSRHRSRAGQSGASLAGLSPTPSSTVEEARTVAPDLPFPVLAPRYEDTTATAAPDVVRRYYIRGPAGRLHPSYVIVTSRGGLGEFYDVEGTTWTNPPLLSDPTSELSLGSRTYSLFYDGEHLHTVSWREHGAVYWVENTLTDSISPRVMVAIAREAAPVAAPRTAAVPPNVRAAVRGFTLPLHKAAASSTVEVAGDALAAVTLLLLAGLSVLVVRRQRELKRLRGEIALALRLEAYDRARAAGQVAPAGGTRAGPPGR